MKIVLLFFMIIFGLIFLVFLAVGSALARLFGKRRSPQDMAVLQNIAALNESERAVLKHSIERNNRGIGILSDQQAIDSLIAKGIVLQSAGSDGVIDYTITDTAWSVLSRTRGL